MLNKTIEKLFEGEFKKQTVIVYSNRVEIIYKESIVKLASKGLTGKFIIYLKHLNAIEYNTGGHIEFMTSSLGHTQSTFNKTYADNVIDFNVKKEGKLAEELINTINALM